MNKMWADRPFPIRSYILQMGVSHLTDLEKPEIFPFVYISLNLGPHRHESVYWAYIDLQGGS
jgi:hypothetical protein